MKLKTFWMILAALCLVRLALMATVPVFEPSEARYAAIAANMARSGDFVIPRFTHKLQYQSFDGKPPLVFQAGGAFCKVFGVREFSVRLMPFLSAALLLLILYHSVRRRSDADAGRLAVIICATCVAFYADAGIAMTDMTLTCCVAGALLLYRLFLDAIYPPSDSQNRSATDAPKNPPRAIPIQIPRSSFAYAAGVAVLLGAGMITKGPVALAMFGLPVLADAIVNRRWAGMFNYRWLVVAPLFFAVAAPWFVLAEQRNPGSLWYFFYNENFLRFVSHDYGDKYGAGREAFRGVSILWAFVATLPWALLPLWNLFKSWRGTKSLKFKFDALKDFEILALLTVVGFWCLTSRVLIYYLFPVIPLFAAALALRGDRALNSRLAPHCAVLAAGVTGLALVAGMFCSDKMRGSATEFSIVSSNYAYEFYHGRKSDAELEKLRTLVEQFKASQQAKPPASDSEK